MVRACLAFGFVSTAMLPVLTWLAAIGAIPSIPYLSLLVWMPSLIIAIVSHFGRMLRGFLLPIFVVLIWTIISLGWVDSTERGRGLLIAAALLTAYGVSVLLWREEAWIENAILFVYGSAVVAIIMGVHWANAGFSEFGTLRGATASIVTNRNGVASQLGFAALLAVSVMRLRTNGPIRNDKSFALVAATILLGFSVVLTGSRGGFLSLTAGMIVFALGNRNWRRISLAECIYAYGAILGLGALAFIPNPLRARLVGTDLSQVGNRVPIWESALKTLEQASSLRWFVGFGTGGSDKAVASQLPDLGETRLGIDGVVRVSTHNTYIEWLVSYGLIGLVFAVLVGVWVIVLVIKSDSVMRSVTGLTMLTFFCIYSVSGIVYKLPYSIAALALFFGYLGMTQFFPKRAISQNSGVSTDRERNQFQQAT